MSRINADLSRVSLNQLCTLTGKTSRTLKKLLVGIDPEIEEGKLLYRPAAVLPVIYGAVPAGAGSGDEAGGERKLLDPQQEKARLDKLKADKVELEIKQLRKDLIPIESIKTSWGKVLAAFRARVLTMPSKLAPKLAAATEAKEAERILKAECHDALKELSEYDAGLNGSKSNQ